MGIKAPREFLKTEYPDQYLEFDDELPQEQEKVMSSPALVKESVPQCYKYWGRNFADTFLQAMPYKSIV